MKTPDFIRSRGGNILIESIVSVSLILIGLLGVFGLISQSIRQNKEVSLRATASYLAAEGIEVMKNIVDTDVEDEEVPWNATVGNSAFETYEVEYDTDRTTLPELNLGGASSTRTLVIGDDTRLFRYPRLGDGSPTPFTRTVTVLTDEGNPDEMRIVSTVEWTERGERKKVWLETVFTNWRSD